MPLEDVIVTGFYDLEDQGKFNELSDELIENPREEVDEPELSERGMIKVVVMLLVFHGYVYKVKNSENWCIE